MLKTVFMGTPDFAVAALQAAASRCSILAVVTQPDKPRGRGKNLQPSPVKVWSMEQGIPVLQPERLRKPEAADAIKRLAPDLIITAAFGQILPPAVLDIPPLGCINVHASLLPRHRGASPIQHALLCGDTKTGITIYYMDEGMDTGDIILMRETAIDPKEHAGRLHDRLAALGAEALQETLARFHSGRPRGIPQDPDLATVCGKIEKSMGSICWSAPAHQIINRIRAFTPWPGAYTHLQGVRLKVWKAENWEYLAPDGRPPGTVLQADAEAGLIVACGDGALRLVQVQLPGGKPMDSREWVKGHPMEAGTVLSAETEM